MKKLDLTGQKFGLLTALVSDGKDTTGKTTWLCQCDCGNKKSITLLNLKSGNSKSCGCKKHLVGIDNPRTITDLEFLKGKAHSFSLRRNWRKLVIARDKCCVKCEATEKLQAHHLKSAREFPDQLLDVNNGATVCFSCHLKFHIKYGRKTGFTPDHFKKFIEDDVIAAQPTHR